MPEENKNLINEEELDKVSGGSADNTENLRIEAGVCGWTTTPPTDPFFVVEDK